MKIVSNALVFVLTLMASFSAMAQGPDRMPSDEDLNRLEAARIGLVTTKLNLTADQAKDFWPVYNEFNNKRKTFRTSMRDLFKKINAMEKEPTTTEEAYKEVVKKIGQLRLQETQTESEYVDKFLKTIKPSQVVKLFTVEKELMHKLMRQMHNKHDRDNDHDDHNDNRHGGRRGDKRDH